MDRNNALFNRTATVGLGGAWGALDVGRQYTIGFKTEKFLDPFDHHYTPIVPLSSGAGTTLPAAARTAGLSASSSSGTRFNNDIQYAGDFNGLTLRAEYAPGEVASDAGKGAARAAGFSYAKGALLAAGYRNHAWIGGGVKFGAFIAKAGMSSERQYRAGARTYQLQTRFGPRPGTDARPQLRRLRLLWRPQLARMDRLRFLWQPGCRPPRACARMASGSSSSPSLNYQKTEN